MKKILAVLLASVMVLSLAACGGSTGAAPVAEATPAAEVAPAAEAAASSDTDSSSASSDGVTITMMASQNWLQDVDTTIAEKFEAETGIHVDIQAAPDDQYLSIVMSKLASGEGPDIYYARAGASIVDFMPETYMLDCSNEAWVSDYEDWALSGTTYNGKVWGLDTWDSSGWVIMYNKEIFDEQGLTAPTNYAEFCDVCDKLLAAGIQPLFHNSGDTWHDLQWINAMAGLIADKDPDMYTKFNNNEAKFADYPELEKALTQLKECVDKGYFGDDYLSNTWNDGYEAMGTGKVAMINTYSAYASELASMYSDYDYKNWSVFVVPFCDNQFYCPSAGGLFKAINKDSKNVEACKEFFNFLTRPEILQEYYKGHPELCKASMKTIEIDSPKGIIDLKDKKSFADFETGILYMNDGAVSKIIQELYLETKTPMECLEAIDEYRQEMFDTAG